MPPVVMRMLVDPASDFTAEMADRSYLAGYDQIPWPARTSLMNGQLLIERHAAESGRLFVPWRVGQRGELMLGTGTLMQRDRAYWLEIELARGKLNQVRNQWAEWQGLGLIAPTGFEAQLALAQATFAEATTTPERPAWACQRARDAIEQAYDAGELLVDGYAEQALNQRLRQLGRLPTLLGVKIGHRLVSPTALSQIAPAFNALFIKLPWGDIESQSGEFDWRISDHLVQWCQEQQIRACSGALLRLDERSLPNWVALYHGDFDNFAACATEFVSQAVSRYRGRMSLWQASARLNVARSMGLREEQLLQLAVRTIDVTRQIDPSTPVILRFDQPWGEYLRRGEFDLSPLHFADALVRSGLPLSGIGLEINVGYMNHGSAARDRLEISRLLDLWSCLGMPLHLMLTYPSSNQPDPKARVTDLPSALETCWTPEHQATWIRRILPLMLAKNYVASVVWGQLSDAEPHEFAHGGLFDSTGAAKPAFNVLMNLRKRCLT